MQGSRILQEVDQSFTADKQKSKNKKRQLDSDKQSKPKRKIKHVPFSKIPKEDKQMRMLHWIGLEQQEIDEALSGTKIEESSIEIRPECVSNKLVDDTVELGDIKEFFSEDAWQCLQNVYETKEKNSLWNCNECQTTIEQGESTIACESCLEWYHYECVGIKRKPRSKEWFCPICING